MSFSTFGRQSEVSDVGLGFSPCPPSRQGMAFLFSLFQWTVSSKFFPLIRSREKSCSASDLSSRFCCGFLSSIAYCSSVEQIDAHSLAVHFPFSWLQLPLSTGKTISFLINSCAGKDTPPHEHPTVHGPVCGNDGLNFTKLFYSSLLLMGYLREKSAVTGRCFPASAPSPSAVSLPDFLHVA